MAKLEDIRKQYGDVDYYEQQTGINYGLSNKIDAGNNYKVPAYQDGNLIGYAIMEKE